MTSTSPPGMAMPEMWRADGGGGRSGGDRGRSQDVLAELRATGHELGSLSAWLQLQLAKRAVPAVCLETKHARAAMSAQRNKTDALALAHIVRTGWFRQAHIKTASFYRLRLLLTQRRNPQAPSIRQCATLWPMCADQ
jgi:transposase